MKTTDETTAVPTLTIEEVRERMKLLPDKGVGIQMIIDGLKEAKGSVSIGEAGIEAVLAGRRGDKHGVIYQFKLITDAIMQKMQAHADRTINPPLL